MHASNANDISITQNLLIPQIGLPFMLVANSNTFNPPRQIRSLEESEEAKMKTGKRRQAN